MIKENENNEYSDINDKVVFVYLPPYSPDLNPIEQVGESLAEMPRIINTFLTLLLWKRNSMIITQFSQNLMKLYVRYARSNSD